MISAKEAAIITVDHRLNTVRTLESVENAIASAASNGNNFVVLNRHLITDEVLPSLISNGYHLDAYNDIIIVSWNTFPDNGRVEKKINNIDNKLSLYLTTNDISNYYTSSSADYINISYRDNRIEPITSSNVESWIAKYIYSNIDRFSNTISCGTKFTIKDGIYNAQWVVVGADTELNKGDVPLTKPHLSLIPATNLGTDVMNDFMISSGAYAGSKMNRQTIPVIVKALQKVLGNHLLARRVKLANSTDGIHSHSNSSAYYTVYANLLCERQVFGISNCENFYDIGDDTEALPGFKNYKDKIYDSSGFWLRSVFDGSAFVVALGDGSVVCNYADLSNGVRPLITIG